MISLSAFNEIRRTEIQRQAGLEGMCGTAARRDISSQRGADVKRREERRGQFSFLILPRFPPLFYFWQDCLFVCLLHDAVQCSFPPLPPPSLLQAALVSPRFLNGQHVLQGCVSNPPRSLDLNGL